MGRFINADGLIATGQGVLGNNMFVYCLNNPILLLDSSGMRAVINTRGCGNSNNHYYHDGKGKSKEVLEYFRDEHSELSDYPDYQMTVTSNGSCYKSTDHSLEYADYVAFNLLLCNLPKIGVFLSIAGFVGGFDEINNVDTFPDGYYDTYTISVSWTDVYAWNDGKTYTYYSYDFIVCWDTISYPEPCWQHYKSIDRTQSKVVYD